MTDTKCIAPKTKIPYYIKKNLGWCQIPNEYCHMKFKNINIMLQLFTGIIPILLSLGTGIFLGLLYNDVIPTIFNKKEQQSLLNDSKEKYDNAQAAYNALSADKQTTANRLDVEALKKVYDDNYFRYNNNGTGVNAYIISLYSLIAFFELGIALSAFKACDFTWDKNPLFISIMGVIWLTMVCLNLYILSDPRVIGNQKQLLIISLGVYIFIFLQFYTNNKIFLKNRYDKHLKNASDIPLTREQITAKTIGQMSTASGIATTTLNNMTNLSNATREMAADEDDNDSI